MKFRHDINGLRAIAVLSVVLFHFNPSMLPGGFVGVDVFFVISGFLMTSIIFGGLEKNSFNIFKFYCARANRIIPALSVLCISLLVFGWFNLTPSDYNLLAKHAASSISFISNMIYMGETGYFDASSHEKWLLHTWSLSVEWQFYILYPLFAIILKRFFSIEKIKKILVFIFILSFGIAIYSSIKNSTDGYYFLPMRAWEMILGGIAYLYPLKINNKSNMIMYYCGIIAIIASCFVFSGSTLWPGYYTLLPVGGAYLIIIANIGNNYITRNKVFQSIGKWSYSIYLWHWPIVVYFYINQLLPYYIYGIALSILLGFISYNLIERTNFNSISKITDIYKMKSVYVGLLAFIPAILVFNTNGADYSFRYGASSETTAFLKEYEDKHFYLSDAYWLKCNTYGVLSTNKTMEVAPECIAKKGDGGVFLWGDSHAEAWSLGVRSILNGVAPFYQKTSAGCYPSLSESTVQTGDFKLACDNSNKVALDSIKKIRPSVVIIAQHDRHELTNWKKLVSTLKSFGVKNVIIMGPLPQWDPSLPKIIIKSAHWKKNDAYITDKGLNSEPFKANDYMKKISDSDGFIYISVTDKICKMNEGVNYCLARLPNGELTAVDYGHLTKDASIYISNKIIKEKLLDYL
ncbi:acyltransferase family protein [Citrobacter freundii]|uniref:acyltransferase family protein n=1 Tax=Citrobacter freundii TaxID=546 RepID=UPI00214D42B8|nr:acyltransferase family protein [Citrobacter freundii]MCR3692788.1 acyltransferase [Citrobacter freundii]